MGEEKPGALLLFDVDGVILDSFEPLYTAISSYVKEHKQLDLSREKFREFFEGNALEGLMKYAGFKKFDMLTAWIHAKSMLFSSYNTSTVFDGMKEALQRLSLEHTLVVVTSSPVEIVTLRFEQVGIYDLFSAYMGPETAVHKDKKIRLACREFNAVQEETFFISDTVGDILEAKQTGVKTVAVTWGYHPRPLLETAKPTQVVDTVKALERLFTPNLR